MQAKHVRPVDAAGRVVYQREQPEDVVVANVVRCGMEDVEKAVLVDGKHPVLPEALVGIVVGQIGPERRQQEAQQESDGEEYDQAAMGAEHP